MVIDGSDVHKCYKSIDLKDAIIFTDMGWNDISKSIVYNCFKHFLQDEGHPITVYIESSTDKNLLKIPSQN